MFANFNVPLDSDIEEEMNKISGILHKWYIGDSNGKFRFYQ